MEQVTTWHKKGQANYIAPLQPRTLASIKTWGSSEGAGRVGLTPKLNSIRNASRAHTQRIAGAKVQQKNELTK